MAHITEHKSPVRNQSALKVDHASCLIEGVKIVGLNSSNGYSYSSNSLKKAMPKYEGAKVYCDHPASKSEGVSRSVRELVGCVRNPRYIEGKGGFADIQLLKTNEISQTLLERAEKMPETFGMSHVVDGDFGKDGTIVEQINEVYSVDFVERPATNKHLTESFNMDMEPEKTSPETAEPAMPDDATVTRVEAIFSAMETATPEQLSEIEAVLGLTPEQEMPEETMPAKEPAMESQARMKMALLEAENMLLKSNIQATPVRINALARMPERMKKTLLESWTPAATGKRIAESQRPKTSSPRFYEDSSEELSEYEREKKALQAK
jgi:hypothetical protein